MGQLAGPTDPAPDARCTDPKPRKGFFTDTSICIGCKACEVACKERNHNPRDRDLELLGSSYDNTGALGASTWRHAAFIEQGRERIDQARETGRALVSLGMPGLGAPAAADPAAVSTAPPDTAEFRWLMSSDVCKHCTHAGCLDVCPLRAVPHRVRHRRGASRCLQRVRHLRGRLSVRRRRAPQRRHGHPEEQPR